MKVSSLAVSSCNGLMLHIPNARGFAVTLFPVYTSDPLNIAGNGPATFFSYCQNQKRSSLSLDGCSSMSYALFTHAATAVLSLYAIGFVMAVTVTKLFLCLFSVPAAVIPGQHSAQFFIRKQVPVFVLC